MALAKIVALTFQNRNGRTAKATKEKKMEGHEKTYPRTDEYKFVDKEQIVELKDLQKRANEPAETDQNS